MDAYIVYHSDTGNTLKVALAVISGLKQAGVGAVASPVEEADPTEAVHFNAIGLGTPTHYNTASRKMQEFANKLPDAEGKKTILFCTRGAPATLALKKLEKIVSKKGYVVAGKFSCLGRDVWGPLKLVGGIHRKHPNMRDLASAAEFAKNLNLG